MYVLEPVVVEKPWGVSPHLIKWSTGIGVHSHGPVGELWIASGLKSLSDMANRVQNADHKMTIVDVVGKKPKEFFGAGLVPPKKLYGKTEAWYVRDVKGDVRTVNGLREGIGKKGFLKLIEDGYFDVAHDFEELERDVFTTVKFERNAFYVMLPGTLHTIYAPDKESYVVIDEMQQGFGDNALPILSKILFVTNSELSVQVHPSDKDVAGEKRKEILEQYATEPTVRVYDFGRGRRSQPRLAAELIRYERNGFIRTRPVVVDTSPGCKLNYLGATKYFARELIEVRRGHECTAPKIRGRYFILHCIDGEGTVTWEGGKIRLERGTTVAVPALLEAHGITTDMGCIFYRDYVPNLRKLRKELSDFGISDEKMASLIISVD